MPRRGHAATGLTSSFRVKDFKLALHDSIVNRLNRSTNDPAAHDAMRDD